MRVDLADLLVAVGLLICAGGLFVFAPAAVVVFAGLVILALGLYRSR